MYKLEIFTEDDYCNRKTIAVDFYRSKWCAATIGWLIRLRFAAHFRRNNQQLKVEVSGCSIKDVLLQVLLTAAVIKK